ncbi:MAG: hypothetical protein GY847_20760 [Proteobacteria bacterium]|nr:hypothetical protein [Pseudomonadota bacterium]
MSVIPTRTRTSTSPLTHSLVLSDVSDAELPFGPPPTALVEIETGVAGIAADLRRRIRALAGNANQVRRRSPLNAAICWHEAGRMLERRASRPAEAWVCYGRALVVLPDHKPSHIALRRLARRAGAVGTLKQLLDAYTDRATHAAEIAALFTESAMIELDSDQPDTATDALNEAVHAWPRALVPQLLKIGIAVREKDDVKLADTLSFLVNHWPEPTVARELNLILALIEERLGHLDNALKRLNALAKESSLSLAGQWVRFRLCLRLNRSGQTAKIIEEMLAQIEAPVMRSALKRIKVAVGALVEDHGGDESLDVTEDDTENANPIWDIELLAATRKGARARVVQSARKLSQDVKTPQLKEALAVSAMLNLWKSNNGSSKKLEDGVDPQCPVGRAVASFFRIDQKVDSDSTKASEKPFAADLHEAMAKGDSETVVRVLASLRERSSEEKDRWALAVAESAVLFEHLKRPEDAIAILRGETDRLNRPPLPALIRGCESNSESLAELAVAEAEDSNDDEFKAWRFGWAAHHMESSDRNEAGRLYLRALELKPTLPLATAGLARSVSDRGVLAEAYMNASEVVTERRERAQCLMSAAVQYLAQGSSLRAIELFGEAFELDPDDSALRNTVVRLALTHLEAALPEFVQPLPNEEAANVDSFFALGSLGLEVDADEAILWFEKVLDIRPGDPIAETGLREAQFKAGRVASVSGNLLSQLREADSPRDEAKILTRLAHVDRWYEEDPSQAALSLLSLDEKLPGHRSSLVRLLIYLFSHNRGRELGQVLAGLSETVTDDADSMALLAAALHEDPSNLTLLNRVVDRDPSAFLETALLERLTEEPDLRTKLLERLLESFHDSAIHLSRLAEARAEAEDHKQAAELCKRALAADPCSIFDLFASARHYRILGDRAALSDTLLRIASEMTDVEYKNELIFEAAEIFYTELKDKHRAAKLCLDILSVAPEDDRAYTMGRDILGPRKSEDSGESTEDSSIEDRRGFIELLTFRLSGISDADKKRQLHLELAHVLVNNGDADERDKAKEHILKALETVSNDLENHRWIAQLHRDDEEWNDAIEHLITAAHLVQDPKTGIEVFFALGALYMDHTEHEDLAEKSFLKVFGWDRSHFQAMQRISDLYLRMGKYDRAAQALEHLIRLADDTSEKVKKMIVLARIQAEHMSRAKDAERLLNEARQIDPLALGPVGALVNMYRRQGDSLALNIQLDRALADQTNALIDDPDKSAIYGNIHEILIMKGDKVLAGFATEAMAIVGVPYENLPDDFVQTRWEIGDRIGDPIYVEHLCPKIVPAGLRETMKAVEEPLAKLEGVLARQISVGSTKLNRRSPLAVMLAEMARAFGIEAPTGFSGADPLIRIAPGSPAAVIFPEKVATTEDPAIQRFAATFSLQIIRLGLSLATVIPPDRLRCLLSSVVRLSVRDFLPKGISENDVVSATERVREVLSDKKIQQIRPFAFDCTDALDNSTLGSSIVDIGYRAGFIGSGSLSSSIAALGAIVGRRTDRLSDMPGWGQLIAFVFSRDHMEIRTRLEIQ